MTVKITVYGDNDVRRKFGALARKVRRTILKESIAAGTVQMARAIRDAAPDKTGRLRRSIRRRVRNDGGKVSATATIYASDKIAPHALDVEFGTGPRTTKSGRYTGEAPAEPFMRPEFEAEAPSTGASVQAHIALRVENEASKP